MFSVPRFVICYFYNSPSAEVFCLYRGLPAPPTIDGILVRHTLDLPETARQAEPGSLESYLILTSPGQDESVRASQFVIAAVTRPRQLFSGSFRSSFPFIENPVLSCTLMPSD